MFKSTGTFLLKGLPLTVALSGAVVGCKIDIGGSPFPYDDSVEYLEPGGLKRVVDEDLQRDADALMRAVSESDSPIDIASNTLQITLYSYDEIDTAISLLKLDSDDVFLDALSRLSDFLEAGDERVRRQAVHAVGRVCVQANRCTDEAIRVVELRLQDSDPDAARYATYSLAAMRELPRMTTPRLDTSQIGTGRSSNGLWSYELGQSIGWNHFGGLDHARHGKWYPRYAHDDKLKKAYDLVRTSPRPNLPIVDESPVSLLQTVNGLVDSGKDATILALQEYLNENRDSTSDAQRVRLIVAMMFDVPSSDDKLPHLPWFNHDTHRWTGPGDTFEFIVVDGIPFNVVGNYDFMGYNPPLDELVDWASKHGIFRRNKLVASADPQQAADKLMANLSSTDFAIIRPTFPKDEDKHVVWLEKHLKAQAEMVADARGRKGAYRAAQREAVDRLELRPTVNRTGRVSGLARRFIHRPLGFLKTEAGDIKLEAHSTPDNR